MTVEPVGQSQQGIASFQQAVAALQLMDVPGTTAAPAPVDGDSGALESQIVQSVNRLWRNGAEEMRVTLRPEYLGTLTIALRVEGDSVTAVLHVDEPQVRAWVQTHEGLLRQAMSHQGLTLAHLVVTDERPGSERRDGGEDARHDRRPPRRREDGDPGPTFEVAA
jgi:flagellar hook-length control protein FliK